MHNRACVTRRCVPRISNRRESVHCPIQHSARCRDMQDVCDAKISRNVPPLLMWRDDVVATMVACLDMRAQKKNGPGEIVICGEGNEGGSVEWSVAIKSDRLNENIDSRAQKIRVICPPTSPPPMGKRLDGASHVNPACGGGDRSLTVSPSAKIGHRIPASDRHGAPTALCAMPRSYHVSQQCM